MQKRLMVLLMFLAVLSLSGLGGSAFGAENNPADTSKGKDGRQVTLKDLQKQTAADRKRKGKMKSTTNDDRWAAATRNADRQAKAVAKGEGVRK